MPDRFTVGGEAVRVEHLSELRGDLRRVSRSLPRIITAANRTVAQSVATAARPEVVTKNHKQAPSRLSAGGTQRNAYVQLAGATAFGDEFGARRYRQFRPHRGRQGYAIFPTVRAKRQEIADTYLDLIESELEKRSE